MPSVLLVFVTWTTYGRTPLITAAHAAGLAAMLPRLASRGGAELTELSVVSTHVHAVLRLRPGCDVSRLMQYLRGGSAFLLNRTVHGHRPLRWAEGYDLRSTDTHSLPRLLAYLDEQGRHHGVPLLVRWSSAESLDETDSAAPDRAAPTRTSTAAPAQPAPRTLR